MNSQTSSSLFNKISRYFFSKLFTLLVTGLLIYGWSRRDSNYITAESGVGYLLGIVGGSLMLVLLLYPLSKRNRLLNRLVPLRFWFGFHMFLGVVGPVMILFHANFQLGSLNSNIALFSMIIVASSGLFGRYFYTHIHHGLYGRRISLQELKQNLASEHNNLFSDESLDDNFRSRLDAIEQKVMEPYSGVFASLSHAMLLAASARRIKKRLTEQFRNTEDYARIKKEVARYVLALRKITAFKLYERLFSLWHLFHLPLFFMMLITAVVHIFAVHMY